ncbi:LOW QUALITY PROTEIN: uncharacterized protein LOC105425823 [Pogonomyrmex barbatus]|uniref:LOW QUALITY PROTEIN: uncharacterized protein LOC105425823 n=1 Tax=Pogonomyrmex barbatus TaxID=144034 RepID=A0A6I9W1U5_9HYME|nr:LOW QUALITY PROTEIN: uncharacterized protein LOC105425823 [Pogonomyrmex barbatus]
MELQVSPVNEETVFSKLKKKRIQKLNGPDSPLYKVIWPFIYIARVFGFAPYNFSQDRIMPSNINLIFTMIATIFYSYALYEVCVKFTNIKRDIPVLGQLEDVKVLINYSVVMYEVGLTMFTRNSFVRIWAALQDYDESVRQLGYSRKETWTAIVAWFFVIVTTVIWIVINRSGMYAFMESWFHNVRYMLPYLGTLVSVYKFVAVVMFLGQRFRHLNAIALQNLPPVTGRGTVTVSKKVGFI